MAHILFLENRGKTALWEKVASALVQRGHRTSWIVQNRMFAPSVGAVAGGERIIIPFPRTGDFAPADESLCARLKGERGAAQFNTGTSHYLYYRNAISATFEKIEPDVVVGEPTLFHEQLVAIEAEALGKPFLHPAMNRYPGGRFQILSGLTQNPVGGSGDTWSANALDDYVDAIAKGRAIPSYMRKRSRLHRLARMLAQAKVTAGWAMGERYNTPSPRRKMALTRSIGAAIESWKGMERRLEPGEPALLYPLQMQPEANLDVWGRPWSDQPETLRQMLRAAPENTRIAVKANPKPKYEMSAALLDLARREPRIVLLPLQLKMDEAQKTTIGTLTVSGTVGYEAAFGKGRCISLAHPVLATLCPRLHATSVPEAVERLLNVPADGRAEPGTGSALLAEIIRTSYAGVVSEPLYDAGCLESENVMRVADALHQVIGTIEKSKETAS